MSQYIEDYHILQTTKEEGLVRAIRNGMEAAAVPVEFSKGEWGRGQEEINLRYAEPLEMADRHTLYKHGAKEIAHAQGSSITFMAKYDMGSAGSSFHLHSSLWDRTGKKSLFYEKGKRFGSALFGHWLAGQMAMAREFSYFYAPYVNSYKRYQAGSFAPTRIVAGWDNRTCGFRLCGEGSAFRVENRIPGADANPYLAFAATIAAGLHGIQKKLRAAQGLRGQRLRGPEAPAGPEDPPRGGRRAGAVPRRARGPRRRGARALPPHRAARAAGVRPGGHRLGADAGLRAHLTVARRVIVNPAAGPRSDRTGRRRLAVAQGALAARGVEGTVHAHRGRPATRSSWPRTRSPRGRSWCAPGAATGR